MQNNDCVRLIRKLKLYKPLREYHLVRLEKCEFPDIRLSENLLLQFSKKVKFVMHHIQDKESGNHIFQ